MEMMFDILVFMLEGESKAMRLMGLANLDWNGLKHRVAVMAQAGLVRIERKPRDVSYFLTPEGCELAAKYRDVKYSFIPIFTISKQEGARKCD